MDQCSPGHGQCVLQEVDSSVQDGGGVFHRKWVVLSIGSGTHSVHEGELLRHHDGVKGQEAEHWEFILEAALFLCGEGTADMLRCRTSQETSSLTIRFLYVSISAVKITLKS